MLQLPPPPPHHKFWQIIANLKNVTLVVIPGVDVSSSPQQHLDDVDIPSRGCQGEGSVVRHVPMFKISSFSQQYLHHLMGRVNVNISGYFMRIVMENYEIMMGDIYSIRIMIFILLV